MERVTGLEPANTSLGSSYDSWLESLQINCLTSLLSNYCFQFYQTYWTKYWKNAEVFG